MPLLSVLTGLPDASPRSNSPASSSSRDTLLRDLDLTFTGSDVDDSDVTDSLTSPQRHSDANPYRRRVKLVRMRTGHSFNVFQNCIFFYATLDIDE